MLVDDRPVETERLPFHNAAGIAHGQRQIDALIAIHAVEEDGHGECRDLRFAHRVVGDAGNERRNLGFGQDFLVTFVTNDLLR